jgi:hypothetical protein
MEQQVSELSTLLNQVLRGKERRFALELLRRDSNQFAQNQTGVIEAQGLIKIAGQQIVFDDTFHSGLTFHLWLSKMGI